MKKIRLNPESLEVQSFTTERFQRARGTVQGAQTYRCVEMPNEPVSQNAQCLESGACLGTRYDYTCDTGYCIIQDTIAPDCVPVQAC